jgi:hypothetical protein
MSRVPPELHLEEVPLRPPQHYQIQRPPSEAVFALDPPAPVHDPLQERHQRSGGSM